MEKLGKTVAAVGFAVVITSAGVILIKQYLDSSKLKAAKKKWNAIGENVVVLHQFSRPTTALSVSPFPAKLETYLRMSNIKYVCDYGYPKHPKTGKSPWITINGQDIADSQLAMEFLAKKFNKDFSAQLGIKEKSASKAFRIMLEDHLYWILMYDRYVDNDAKYLTQFWPMNEVCRLAAVKKMKNQCYMQGISRFCKGDIQKMGIEDLQAISNYLGSKLYLMGGDNPTEVDCCLFAFLSIILYTSQEGSVFKMVVEKRLGNLLQFTKRMRNNCYPDWDEIVGKDSLTELKIEPPARPPPPTKQVKNAPQSPPAKQVPVKPNPQPQAVVQQLTKQTKNAPQSSPAKQVPVKPTPQPQGVVQQTLVQAPKPGIQPQIPKQGQQPQGKAGPNQPIKQVQNPVQQGAVRAQTSIPQQNLRQNPNVQKK